MEPVDVSITDLSSMNENLLDVGIMENGKVNDEAAEVARFRHHLVETVAKVDELERRVNEVAEFYSSLSKKQPNSSKGYSALKDKDNEKQISSVKKQPQDAVWREAARTKRMQKLMRQFSTILGQITQHGLAWPFLQPVDVEGLGLHDYYEVIDKPMDFSTIYHKKEAKDGAGYMNVREICADVRLVFKNAMTYNDERNDIHVMAKTLLAKFEKKWSQLLPKVIEEERRRKEEEEEVLSDMHLAQEAENTKIANDISNELHEVDMHLEELRETVVQKCRKISTGEKKKTSVRPQTIVS